MFPIYMWVKGYKGLENFGITFDNNYKITFEDGILTINKAKTDNNIENFYSIDKTIGNIDSVNLLIGKNGSGKTSVLQLLTLIPKSFKKTILHEDIYLSENYADASKLDHFIVYKNFENEKEENFVIEKCSNEKKTGEDKSDNIGTVRFNLYDDGNNNSFFYKNSAYGKLNFGIKYVSKKKIYNYLNNQNKLSKKNFENAKMTIVIKDMYSNSEYLNIITESNEENFYNLKLYEINEEEDIKDIILKNYCNELFLRKLLYGSKSSKITKDFIEEKKGNLKDKNLIESYLELSKNSVRKNFRKNFYEDIITISKNISNLVKKNKIIKINNTENDELAKFYINKYKNDKDIEVFLEHYDEFRLSNPDEYERLKGEYKEDDIAKVIPIFEEGLSAGEKVKLEYFSSIYGVLNGEFKDKEFKDKKYVTLLFDEVETYLHPEWCRRFLYELIEELGRYKGKKFKLIFATHSPFLIADVLAKDCIYLSKDENGKIQAEIKEDVKTFGANIIDLFKDTMFLESTFGKFATEKIKWVVDEISDSKKNYSQIKNNSEIKFLIDEIGEKLISNKLKSMIESKFKGTKEEYYYKKIRQYKMKLKKLRNKKDKK